VIAVRDAVEADVDDDVAPGEVRGSINGWSIARR
jgi:hypothetical protein